MLNPTWDADGYDRKTFAPFELQNALDSKWKDVRVSFSAWKWLHQTHGTDTIDDYYLNGYGVQGLVLAARLNAGLVAICDGMDCNSEGDTCYIHFSSIDDAVQTSTLGATMIADLTKIRELIPVANEHAFDE